MMNKLQWLWLDRKYLLGKRKEALLRAIAWHLPHRLVMWCSVRVVANATSGEYVNQSVMELKALDAIDRWEVTE